MCNTIREKGGLSLSGRHWMINARICFCGTNRKYVFVQNRPSSQTNRHLLALPVLQIEMWIEVDEDPLVETRRRYHPCASLRGGIRHGVSRRGEVVGAWNSDVTSTFICGVDGEESKSHSAFGVIDVGHLSVCLSVHISLLDVNYQTLLHC